MAKIRLTPGQIRQVDEYVLENGSFNLPVSADLELMNEDGTFGTVYGVTDPLIAASMVNVAYLEDSVGAGAGVRYEDALPNIPLNPGDARYITGFVPADDDPRDWLLTVRARVNSSGRQIGLNTNDIITFIDTADNTRSWFRYIGTSFTAQQPFPDDARFQRFLYGTRVKLNTTYKIYAWNGLVWVGEAESIRMVRGWEESPTRLDRNAAPIRWAREPDYIYGVK